VTEADYWAHLEYRVSHELGRTDDNTLRFLWCDGFAPEEYFLNDRPPRITGGAWIGNGPQEDRWVFELFLERSVPRREDVPWAPCCLPMM
jgi:hypothetical protein